MRHRGSQKSPPQRLANGNRACLTSVGPQDGRALSNFKKRILLLKRLATEHEMVEKEKGKGYYWRGKVVSALISLRLAFRPVSDATHVLKGRQRR